jgi:hypothetical protein
MYSLVKSAISHDERHYSLHRYSPYYILNPIPYYWSMTSSPPTLTASLVGDSVPCYPYHSFGLWLSLPFALTLLPVSDSVSFYLPILVLPLTAWSVLSPQPLKPNKLIPVIINFTLTLGHCWRHEDWLRRAQSISRCEINNTAGEAVCWVSLRLGRYAWDRCIQP